MEKREQWFAFALLPFKEFIVLAIPFYFLFRVFVPQPLFKYLGNGTSVVDPLAGWLLLSFSLCGPVLLISSIIQSYLNPRAALRTLLFSIIPFLVFVFYFTFGLAAHLM